MITIEKINIVNADFDGVLTWHVKFIATTKEEGEEFIEKIKEVKDC